MRVMEWIARKIFPVPPDAIPVPDPGKLAQPDPLDQRHKERELLALRDRIAAVEAEVRMHERLLH